MPSWVYLYLNPRIRALLSYMLPKETVYRILDSTSLAEVQNIFLSTYYGKYFEGLDFTPDTIELALRRHFFELYSSISRGIMGEEAKFFYAFLKKYDASNLKCVMRGLHAQIPLEDIMKNIVPVGKFGTAYYLNMVETGAIKEAISRVSDVGLHEALEAVYPRYETSNEIFLLESAIDQEVYTNLWKITTNWKAGKTFGARERFLLKGLIGEDIDFSNMLIALRAISLGLNPEDFYLPMTYRINEELKTAATATSMEDAIQIFSQSPYYRALLEEVREKGIVPNILMELEAHLQQAHVRKCKLKLSDYPFQISIIYSFLTLKFFELHDLKTLLTGKLEEIDPLRIQKLLIYYH